MFVGFRDQNLLQVWCLCENKDKDSNVILYELLVYKNVFARAKPTMNISVGSLMIYLAERCNSPWSLVTVANIPQPRVSISSYKHIKLLLPNVCACCKSSIL